VATAARGGSPRRLRSSWHERAYRARMSVDGPVSLPFERLRRQFAELHRDYIAAGLEAEWEAEAAKWNEGALKALLDRAD
jgi:hypothetical protein